MGAADSGAADATAKAGADAGAGVSSGAGAGVGSGADTAGAGDAVGTEAATGAAGACETEDGTAFVFTEAGDASPRAAVKSRASCESSPEAGSSAVPKMAEKSPSPVAFGSSTVLRSLKVSSASASGAATASGMAGATEAASTSGSGAGLA